MFTVQLKEANKAWTPDSGLTSPGTCSSMGLCRPRAGVFFKWVCMKLSSPLAAALSDWVWHLSNVQETIALDNIIEFSIADRMHLNVVQWQLSLFHRDTFIKTYGMNLHSSNNSMGKKTYSSSCEWQVLELVLWVSGLLWLYNGLLFFIASRKNRATLYSMFILNCQLSLIACIYHHTN